MAEVLLDTSFVYALADRDDSHHAAGLAALKSLKRGDTLVLPNFLLAESHTIINRRLGPQAARNFLNAALQDYHIESAAPEDEMSAHALLQDVSRSRDFSYFDAVAAVIARRLGIVHVLTFDRHFRQLGFEILKA